MGLGGARDLRGEVVQGGEEGEAGQAVQARRRGGRARRDVRVGQGEVEQALCSAHRVQERERRQIEQGALRQGVRRAFDGTRSGRRECRAAQYELEEQQGTRGRSVDSSRSREDDQRKATRGGEG